MIELHRDRAEEVHNELAMTGRYFNTGKVLMGVSHVPRPRSMSRDEERIQSALLKEQASRITAGTWGYIALLVGIAAGLYLVSGL